MLDIVLDVIDNIRCNRIFTTEEYKKLTNFEATQKTLADITLDLPNVPNIKELKSKFSNRCE